MDYLAKAFLFFTHEQFILPLLVIGYICIDKDTFYHAICLTFISMLFNSALKVSFKIPLSPLIGKEGFAFPSGHMQLATVLYIWLAYRSNSLLMRILVSILLTGIACSLLYFNFHNYQDIFGALFFATVLLILYNYTINKSKRNGYLVVLTFSLLIMLYIYIVTSQIDNYVKMAFLGLFGFVVAERLCTSNSKTQIIYEKIAKTAICFILICIIMYISSSSILKNYSSIINDLRWFLIGFIVPCVNSVNVRRSKERKI